MYRQLRLATSILIAVVAAIPCAAEKKVKFEHPNPDDRFRRVAVSPGDLIEITINDTAGDGAFSYSIEPIVESPEPGGPRALPAEFAATPKVITQVHHRRYGGYIVHARAKLAGPIKVKKSGWPEAKEVSDARFVVAVEPIGWDYELSGGFTIGLGLDDPKFAIRDETIEGSDQPQKIVVRDNNAEDEYRLGVGAMIHIFHHERASWLAGTFGIAINDGNRASYFVGPSLRLSSKAALTGGVSFTSVSRLPVGVEENDPVSDENILNNLGTKVDNGWFVSFSYTFLNPGLDAFTKPFKGDDESK